MGCYVPAEFASFRLSDHIFSRVGSDDDIDTNTSSFTMEMKEVNFLFYCSPSSQGKYIKFLTTPYIHHFLRFFFVEVMHKCNKFSALFRGLLVIFYFIFILCCTCFDIVFSSGIVKYETENHYNIISLPTINFSEFTARLRNIIALVCVVLPQTYLKVFNVQ